MAKNPAAVTLGKLGGAATKGIKTEKKAAAARANGKRGGRPKGAKDTQPRTRRKAKPDPGGRSDRPMTETRDPKVITAHVCGGRQARTCRVTGKEHDMTAVVRWKDGGSVACKDCGVTAMQIDLMELP